MNNPAMKDRPTVAFVCVQNAGRSQMATAFARRENEQREAGVKIITGGTQPADHVHGAVIDVMEERGFDLTTSTPRKITPRDIDRADYVITMGCSSNNVCPANWSGESREWNLDDPEGKSPEEARRIRDEIEERVRQLFDELHDNP